MSWASVIQERDRDPVGFRKKVDEFHNELLDEYQLEVANETRQAGLDVMNEDNKRHGR